jgi:hypothetical protein
MKPSVKVPAMSTSTVIAMPNLLFVDVCGFYLRLSKEKQVCEALHFERNVTILLNVK